MEPSKGEVSAVVGFGGQFEIAARVVLAKISTLEWIRVADPEAGVADDFQFKAGPRHHALQVKWSQHAGSFTWSDLTSGKGDQPGLLAKLAAAWQRLKVLSPDPLTVYLCTNNHASNTKASSKTALGKSSASGTRSVATFMARSLEPVQDRIRNGLTNWSEISQLSEVVQWGPVWAEMHNLTELGDEDFVGFIGDLELKFGLQGSDPLIRPDQDPNDSDIEHLAQTLQNIVRHKSQQVHFTRDQIMDRLGWTERLRYRYVHNFPMPTVYTTNEAARLVLESRMDQLAGGYVALIGPAGSGKSTLLASLRLPGIVARYYAFVPDASDPLSSRGEAESYLHDVSLALEEGGLPRRGIGNDLLSRRGILERQLEAAGLRWRNSGERTFIVVDGLDHIPREQNPSRSLLDELPSPAAIPDGVFVVLGTQSVSILPLRLQEALDEDGRIVVLPPLSVEEVERIATLAGLSDWLYPGQVRKVAEASEGHPLALTYILQELTALAASEPEITIRREQAEGLLADASGYGGDVESRYRGYFQAISSDGDVLEMVGMVARIRVPVNLDWLSTWADARVVSAFADQTATFFRRSGADWQFIHNSFRRFLSDETAKIGDRVNEVRNRGFHEKLSDICGNSGEDWLLYRDEEIAHRFLADQHGRVLELATPERLRQSLLELRPSATVRDHALIALRSATRVDNASSFLLMLMFLVELQLRGIVLESEKLTEAVLSFDSQLASEHIVRGGRLRIDRAAALESAIDYAVVGDVSAAQRIVRACGGLAGISGCDTPSPGEVADWAEVTWRLSGFEAVLAELDHHLPPPKLLAAPPLDAESQVENERAIVIAECRDWVRARCCDLAAEIRDDESLDLLVLQIDAEASPEWRARARYVRALTASQDRLPQR